MYYLNLVNNNYYSYMNKKETGSVGENIATEYLVKNGYKILHTNWTCRWGELDIIAQKKQNLAFFEVKTRSSTYFGLPFEAISFYKKRALLRAINNYIASLKVHPTEWTLDLLGVELTGNNYKLYHWEDLLN